MEEKQKSKEEASVYVLILSRDQTWIEKKRGPAAMA